MKTGDYIRQEYTDTTALVISQLKNGSFNVYAHDYRGRVVQKSTKGWYPPPVVINRDNVPPKIIAKIDKYLLAKYI